MARTRKPSPMRAAIIKAASELFFDKGFSKTTSSEVCKKADVGTGNLTFYFPTKEHILAVLVEMMHIALSLQRWSLSARKYLRCRTF